MSHIDEKAVFNAARAIGHAGERERYLEAACRGDTEAFARIRELLRAHEDEGSFLESPAAPEPPLESPGATVGPYRLLEQIGEGGFGVVFLAEQTAPVRRRVALKVLKPGMDTKQVIARFEAERQALALMDHPNIARVFDAGTTGSGRPYFVMELVKGIPITEYCDAHRLTPRERLELFVTVCHAVQHAHQKGIIHRDIKPSNVLVTLHDDRPVAKVIDFGIAKATSGPLTDKTVFTAFAQMIGTPLYMSPEQAASALDVDTRSDVYSLGVLLYELLTGTTPFDKARLKDAGFDEVRRIIREEEPATPSTRLSTSDALPSVAANRGTEPSKLTRLVRGELDWIVMKALEKDRTRRYETANGFAMDVQRYLADEAVSACPPSAGYRLRKFARRNRRALVASALAAAMLLVVAGSLGWIARDGAARRARNAEAVAILLDQCEEALRSDAADRATVALEAAQRRAADGGAGDLEARLARCLADLKLLRELDAIATLRWTWTNNTFPGWETPEARTRAALAEYGVVPDQSRVEEVARRIAESPIRDRILNALDRWLVFSDPVPGLCAVLRAADPDPYRNAFRDAIAARDRAAVIGLAAQPEALAQPARFAAVLGLLGSPPVERKRAVMESALRTRPGDLDLLMGLAATFTTTRHTPSESDHEFLRWLQAAVAAHPRNVAALNNLAVVLADQEEVDAAIALFRRAIEIDPTFARGHANLGSNLANQGKLEEAIACYRRAIELAPNHAPNYTRLGIILTDSGDVEGATRNFEIAVGLDPKDAIAQDRFGQALLDKGETDRAIVHVQEAIRLDPNRSNAHLNLGVAWFARGDREGAMVEFREAIRADASNANAHLNLGEILRLNGDRKAAISSVREAIRLDANDPNAYLSLGRALRDERDPEAVACFREAIRLDPSSAEAHRMFGLALIDAGNPADGVAALRTAIKLHPSFADAFNDLGNALLAKDNQEAAACYRQAIELDPKPAIFHNNLGSVLHARGEIAGAMACFQEAIRRDPNLALGHYNIGVVLSEQGDLDGAIKRYEEAVRLDPNLAMAHQNLARSYHFKEEADKAIASYEAAIRLNPKDAQARHNLGLVWFYYKGDPGRAIACYEAAVLLAPSHADLRFELGVALTAKGRIDDAIASYEEARRLDPNDARVRHNLVILLHDRDPDRAIAVYEAAIRVDPNHAEMYCGLGQCLMGRGRFAEALVVLRKGHELGRQRPGWALPSEQWVQEAERMSALEARLPHVLAGEVASPEDLVRLADTCLRHKNRYADAALLYGKAFAADPSLTREPGGPRYHAACAAALAARGKGVGAEALASSERARLRALAFEWLRAEYIGYGELPAGDPAAAEQVLNRLQHWLGDPDLSAVRDPVELAKLPDDERDRWTKLWAAVQKLRARAAKE